MMGVMIRLKNFKPVNQARICSLLEVVSSFQLQQSSVQMGICRESSGILEKGSSPVTNRRRSLSTCLSSKKVRVEGLVFLRHWCRGPLIPQTVLLSLLYFLIRPSSSSMASTEGVFNQMFMSLSGKASNTDSRRGIFCPVDLVVSRYPKSRAITSEKVGSCSQSKKSISSSLLHVLLRLVSWCTTNLLFFVRHTSISSMSEEETSPHLVNVSRVFSSPILEPPL